ncbi:cytochrome b561 and DOMON domain-containing protein at5g47530 [Phtheirospermum japonicum]|uniref:Cytochrome b561 and DOMON domain-containing protein at5g47530 n=1 Tax=Phtheirospermum japonicum TaxID=374723 RepID=A0A830CIK8_9LAMI|nr:cytochrome b561 and DOMON domain-containing protein at5g47530 [Phtheirospermum japonicum]
MEINKTKNVYQHCRMKTLEAEFGWNFETKSRKLDIAFGAKLDDETEWLAWGLNPLGRKMVGTRALIGIKHQNGSLEWHKYNVTDATKHGCPFTPSADIGLNVSEYSFVYLENIDYYAIMATIFLPHEYNISRVNVVWQIGGAAVGNQPLMHPISLGNFNTAETLNLVSGEIMSHSAHFNRRMRTIVGYIIGSMGWALGMWLGGASRNYCFRIHRILGICIFTFSTVQMMALRFKPHHDDVYRRYWNMYHHFLGYSLIPLISVNIFHGIKIVAPDHAAWKWGYIGVLGALGAVAMAFEVFTWTKFLSHRKPRGVVSGGS